MNYKGEILKPLDLSGLDNILDALKADGVEAIAVSLLHAYANPDHEAELAEAVRRRWPEVSVGAAKRGVFIGCIPASLGL